MTSASKSFMLAEPAASSETMIVPSFLPLYSDPAVGPTTTTVAPAERRASRGPVSSLSSKSCSTSRAIRFPESTAVSGIAGILRHNHSVNRLAGEQSPYLLQHAANPVNWFPWGEDAFQKARNENKPIFLSIGYSTCHWCHVMAHESFENDDVASVLNEWFVPIKVDREERPDVDRVYMTFVQATTGSGGWPMSVWLTTDLKPFYGGTYFPPSSRWGRPGFMEILQEIARVWEGDRENVVRSADALTRQLQDLERSAASATVPGVNALSANVRQFRQAFDERH